MLTQIVLHTQTHTHYVARVSFIMWMHHWTEIYVCHTLNYFVYIHLILPHFIYLFIIIVTTRTINEPAIAILFMKFFEIREYDDTTIFRYTHSPKRSLHLYISNFIKDNNTVGPRQLNVRLSKSQNCIFDNRTCSVIKVFR